MAIEKSAKILKMKISYHIIFALGLFLAFGCNVTKHIPEGERLYIGGKVEVIDSTNEISGKKKIEKELESILRPKPNRKFLGTRARVFYHLTIKEPKKKKGLRNWLKNKIGEPPVYESRLNTNHNEKIIANFLENKGYFKVKTSAETEVQNKKVKAHYKVHLGVQYKIAKVTFSQDSSKIAQDVLASKEESLLKQGDAYNLDIIKAERVRIDNYLKELGYYYFNDDWLIVQVDSSIGNQSVSLHIKVKDETPLQAKRVYDIGKVYVYTNYNINEGLDSLKNDFLLYEDLHIADEEAQYKPQLFRRMLIFNSGETYNRDYQNKSLNRLLNLGTFGFVSNQFKISEDNPNALDTYYYLTPLKKKSIRLELTGKTTSANFAGSEINLNRTQRNTFKGAERLTISAFGGFDFQISGQNRGYNIFRFGTDATLILPKLLLPFKIKNDNGFVPRTKMILGYEMQLRTKLYAINSLKFSYGYLWKKSVKKEHQLQALDINYLSPVYIKEEYLEQTALNPALARVTDKQLIFGPTYTFTFTNTMEDKKNTFYFRNNIEAVGNFAGLVSRANVKQGAQRDFLGVAFSQYLKLESDFRDYFKLGKNTQLAGRVVVGVGLPYGNSEQLPFIKQFFSGGTNSVRAFRARSIGPGSYDGQTSSSSFLPDQSGDIKLELNAELRTKLFSVVHGALFVDAGNIWLFNEDENLPGANFTKDFYRELAVGVGAGLRFDFSFLILRTDLAFPIRNPTLPDGERWTFNQIDFGSGSWRKQNLVFNLAIGYPF